MSTFGSQLEIFKNEFRGAWRFRWIAVTVAWIVAVSGWVGVYFMPDVYEARSRVYVETSTELRPLLQGLAIETDIQSQLDLVRQALLSRPTLERVAHVADLDADNKSPLEREALIDDLRKQINISVEMARGTNNYLYSMTFRNPNREKSVVVVSTLLDTLINEVIGKKRSGQEDAQQFLESQIADYERRLSAAEERLADFKKRNMGLVPGESGDYFSRLQAENEALETSRGALRVAEVRRAALATQLRGETPYVPVADTPTSRSQAASTVDMDTTTRLQQAEARLQELLLRYTEQHPEVIELKASINELRSRQKLELEALREGKLGEAGGRSAFLNPVHQQIQLSLNQADVEIATVRGQIADHERRSAQLRKMADTAPEVEAEYARLNRDYGVTRAQYQSMVERLERARLSDKADESGTVKFNVIDPPVAKIEPVAPKRGLLISASLILGLLAGAGAAYLLHLTRPVFQNTKSLAEATGLRVLGSVSLARPEAWRIAQVADTRRVVIALSLLFAVCATVLVTENFVTGMIRQLITGT